MKILLINDNHNTNGGAENYFFDLKNRLKRLPDITVYSIGFAEKEYAGDDFYTFKALTSNIRKLIGRFIPNPFLLRRLKTVISAFKPDVIHLHNVKQYPATILRALASYPVVHTAHDFNLLCPTSQNIHQDLSVCSTGMGKKCFWQHRVKYNAIVYLLMSLSWSINKHQIKKVVNAYLAPSPLLADYLRANGHFPAFSALPFRKEISAPAFNKLKPSHFLFAGSLASHKGVHLLIEEFSIAVKSNPFLTLTIAGFGPLEKELRNRVSHLSLTNHVQFLGWEKNLTHYYHQAMAVIFPSIWLEAFGLVITEAMSYGRPVIGINRGTTAWLVEDGKTGLLFDPFKKGDLAKQILRLAGNMELTEQLGLQGQKRLEELINNEHELEQIVRIYREVAINKPF